MSAPARRCPVTAAPAGAACPDRSCPADPQAPMPRQGRPRAVMLVLRFVAAAAETGDGACFDAAFAEAEAVFGPRDGALVVARAAALLRAARRDDIDLALLPPACRALSRGEAGLLAVLRERDGGLPAPAAPRRPGRVSCGVTRHPASPSARDGQDGGGGPTRSCSAGSPGLAGALADLATALADAGPAACDPADWTGSELAASQFPLILS